MRFGEIQEFDYTPTRRFAYTTFGKLRLIILIDIGTRATHKSYQSSEKRPRNAL